MEDEENTIAFHEVIDIIKKRIEEFDISEWKNIVNPEDPKYNEYFDQLVKGEYEEKKDGIIDSMKETELSGPMRINKEYFDSISNREKFFFLLHIKEVMESSWLYAQKRIEGIKSEEESESVNIQDLIQYSQKLSDTVCAPTETDNIHDRILHQEYYPNYHFLNYVSVEEIHLSSLFNLQKYSNLCFPPIIRLEEENEKIIIHISCSTPGVTIYYKVNEDIVEKVYDPDHKPTIFKSKKVKVSAWSFREGYIKSRPSCYTKSYQIKETLSSDLLNKEEEQISLEALAATKGEEPTESPKDTRTKGFKNLGLLLKRKKEKEVESESESESNGSST